MSVAIDIHGFQNVFIFTIKEVSPGNNSRVVYQNIHISHFRFYLWSHDSYVKYF